MTRKEELNTLSMSDLIDLLLKKEQEIANLKGSPGYKAPQNAMWPHGKSYHEKWTWASKVVYAVHHAGHPVQAPEILKFLHKYDPRARGWHNGLKSLSVHIHAAQKHKRLIPYKMDGMRGNYYCLPEWLDSEEKLHIEYSIQPDFK